MHCELEVYGCFLTVLFRLNFDSSCLDHDTVDTHTLITVYYIKVVYYRSYTYYTYTVH